MSKRFVTYKDHYTMGNVSERVHVNKHNLPSFIGRLMPMQKIAKAIKQHSNAGLTKQSKGKFTNIIQQVLSSDRWRRFGPASCGVKES
jgi:hypothetical protein